MLPARLKHFISVICLVTFIGLLIPASVSAQPYSPNTDSTIPNNVHNRAQVLLIESVSAVICQLIGIDVINPQQPCLGINQTTKKVGFLPKQDNSTTPQLGGAVGLLIPLITMTYQLPIHTGDYTSYIASNFGLTKPVYAQGTGFTNLSSLMQLWIRIRDLSYLFFVLIFVIIGFAIMLRIKIDPRTAMSIQNQIPRIIISILLITFSYAIAGVLVDFMWVTTYTGINILTNGVTCQNGGGNSMTSVATQNLLDTPFQYMNQLLGCPFNTGLNNHLGIEELARRVGYSVADIITRVVWGILGHGDFAPNCSGVNFLTNFDDCVAWGFFNIIRGIINVLAMLIFIIAILVQLFRIWLELIKAYIYSVLYTLVAPLWILLGLVPGAKGYGFGSWMRHMVFSLIIYPFTAFLFVIAIVIANDPNVTTKTYDPNSGALFVPPLVANPNIENNIGYILALAVILITPQAVAMMREVFNAPQSKHTPAIMAGIGVGASVIGAPVNAAKTALFKRDQAGQAVGPLAYASDRFIGSRLRRFASGEGIIAKSLRNRYKNTYNEIDNELIAKKAAADKKVADAKAAEEAKKSDDTNV